MGILKQGNLKDIIEEIARNAVQQNLEIWQVLAVDAATATVDIRHPALTQTVNDVPVAMIGAGHLKGIIKMPDEGDFVLVSNLVGRRFVLMSIFDTFTSSPDQIPPIQAGEMMFINKSRGSFIKFDTNDNIIIKTASGNSEIRIKEDGTIEITGTQVKFNGGSTQVARNGDSVSVSGTTDSGGSPSHTHTITSVAGTITSGNPNVVSD